MTTLADLRSVASVPQGEGIPRRMSRFTEQVHAVIEDLKDITVTGTSYITAIDPNEGLQVTAGSLGTVLNTSGGLQAGASGLAVKLNGASLTLGASGLSVTTPAVNFITAVDASEGLEVNAGSLGTIINASGGLQVGASGFGVKLDGTSLTLGASGIKITGVARGGMALSSASTTTITTQYAFVLIAGTTFGTYTNLFTVSSSNRITYTGSSTIVVLAQYHAAVKSAVAGSKEIHIHVKLNGTAVIQRSETLTTATNEYVNVAACSFFTLEQNDYLELFVANFTDTTDIVVSLAYLSVVGIH